MRHSMSLFIIIIFLFVMNACQVQPRYGVEQKKRKTAQNSPKDTGKSNSKIKGLTTFELLRLGQIIETYLGKPYKGSSRSGEGLDCSQLVVQVYSKFNSTKMPRTAGEQFKFGRSVSHRELRFGDLVFFRIKGNRVSHVGIYIENNEFVHASLSNGVIISSLKDSYWEKRYAGCRRVLN